MHRDNSRLSAAAGATAGAAPIVDRTLSQLLHKHHQDMLSSDSVLQCASMLQDILDAVASSANPNTNYPVVVVAPPVASSSGKGAATTSTQSSSSSSSTAALVSSILNYVHATCSGSTPVAPTDLQALTAPINTSSLRPLALMMTPSLILSLLEAQHYEMLGTVLSNNNDKSSDATITSNNTALRNLLLVRIYSSMRNAMQRNQSILYPENLPGGARSPNTTTNPANTTSPATTSASPAGSASGRVGGNSSNQQQDNDCGPAAAAANIRAARNRHDATYLSRAALRGQVMSAAVYQVPNYSGAVTFENISVIAYTALCGFVYVWHNISTTRDMSYVSSARVLAKSAMTLLNDTRYWNLARGDSALCCVNTAMLHLASMSLGPSSGQTGSANDPTNHPSSGDGGQRGQRNGSTGGDDDGANLYLDALRLWSTECFLHAEHTQAALALLPLMAASGSC